MQTSASFGMSLAAGSGVLTASGELDMTNAPRFGDALGTAIAAGRPGGHLSVDLRSVSFFDGASLRVLLKAERAAHSAGVGFALAPSPEVCLVLDVVGDTLAGSELLSANAAARRRRVG